MLLGPLAGVALAAAGLMPDVMLPSAAASPCQAKTIIITGSNSGIGFNAAQKLVAGGHKVSDSFSALYITLNPSALHAVPLFHQHLSASSCLH